MIKVYCPYCHEDVDVEKFVLEVQICPKCEGKFYVTHDCCPTEDGDEYCYDYAEKA